MAPRWRRVLLPAIGAVTIFVVILFSPKGVVDDAYISLRASLHVIEGDGLVFNLDEHVEAFSNLLWTIMMAVPIGLGLSPGYAAGYGGVILGLVATVRAGQHAKRHGGSPVVTVGLIALCPAFWSMAFFGLEGGLYALLLVELIGAVLDERPWRIGIIGGLLFSTRVESVVLLAPVVLVLAFRSDAGEQRRRDLIIRVGAVWLGIVAAITIARYAYFGDVLPNSVRAKSGGFLDVSMFTDNLVPGRQYIRDSIPTIGALLFLPLLGLAVRPRTAPVLALLAFGTAVVVAVRNGGDWMPHFRLLTPYVPMLATAAGITAMTLWTVLRVDPRRFGIPLAGVLAATVAGLVVVGLLASTWTSPSLALIQPYDQNRRMALALREQLRDDDIVTVEALGYFSYYAPDAYVHDFLGLADRHIAESGVLVPPWGKVDYRYTIDEIRPTVILLHSGYGHFRQMMAVTADDLTTEYRIFALCPVEDLDRRFFFVGIQRDAVERLVPSLEPLGLCEIGFPS